MKRLRLTGLLVLVFAASAGTASAQFMGQLGARPSYNWRYGNPVSPYLNLNRIGSNPAVNYYGLVRPQVDTARSLQNLQTEIAQGGAGQMHVGPGDALQPSSMLATGHPVAFFNTSHYFGMNLRGGASPGNSGVGMGGRNNLPNAGPSGVFSTPSGGIFSNPTSGGVFGSGSGVSAGLIIRR